MKFCLLSDYPEFATTIAQWYFHQWGQHQAGVSQEKILGDVNAYRDRRTPPLMLIAVENHQPVGAVEIKRHEMKIYPDKEHWIGGVYVLESARGQGLASRLVAKAVGMATEAGIHTLYLQTPRLDGGIYGKLGFRPLEEVDYKGNHVLVMALPLPMSP